MLDFSQLTSEEQDEFAWLLGVYMRRSFQLMLGGLSEQDTTWGVVITFFIEEVMKSPNREELLDKLSGENWSDVVNENVTRRISGMALEMIQEVIQEEQEEPQNEEKL